MKFQKAILLLTLLPALGWAADSVKMEPGLWEMTISVEMSMFPQPQVRTVKECVEEEEFNPDHFNADENSPCDNSAIEVDGDTISWQISCPGPMGSMTGDWTFTTTGDTISGNGSMSASLGGQSMEFTMKWEGERTGDCE